MPGTASCRPTAPVGLGPALTMPPSHAQAPTAMLTAALEQTRVAMSSAVLPPMVQWTPPSASGIAPSTTAMYSPLWSREDLLEGVFGGLARSGHDDLVILPGEELEDEVADGGVSGAEHGLGVAGAVLEFEPDQDGALGLVECRDHGVDVAWRKGEDRGHAGAEFHELAAGDALGFERGAEFEFRQCFNRLHRFHGRSGWVLHGFSGVPLAGVPRLSILRFGCDDAPRSGGDDVTEITSIGASRT
jgi:hypothetical protein